MPGSTNARKKANGRGCESSSQAAETFALRKREVPGHAVPPRWAQVPGRSSGEAWSQALGCPVEAEVRNGRDQLLPSHAPIRPMEMHPEDDPPLSTAVHLGDPGPNVPGRSGSIESRWT